MSIKYPKSQSQRCHLNVRYQLQIAIPFPKSNYRTREYSLFTHTSPSKVKTTSLLMEAKLYWQLSLTNIDNNRLLKIKHKLINWYHIFIICLKKGLYFGTRGRIWLEYNFAWTICSKPLIVAPNNSSINMSSYATFSYTKNQNLLQGFEYSYSQRLYLWKKEERNQRKLSKQSSNGRFDTISYSCDQEAEASSSPQQEELQELLPFWEFKP